MRGLARTPTVNPESERLIDLVTRPLVDDSEVHLSGVVKLREILEAHAACPTAVKEAADSLARADQQPHRGRWKVVLLVVTLLISMPLFVDMAKLVGRASDLRTLIASFFPGGPAIIPTKMGNFNAAESLLINGDVAAKNMADRWKPLWTTEPDNPIYFAAYAAGYFKDHDNLSAEILATAERIDPDNGWFLAMAAAANADAAVTKEKRAPKEKRSPKEVREDKPVVMTIRDEMLLDETLAILRRVATKPQFTSHENELLAQQIRLFPQRWDWVSQVPLLCHVGGMNPRSIPLRKLSGVLAAGAARCAAKGDADGFRKIARDWYYLARSSTAGADTLIDLLVARVTMTAHAANFRDAAHALGLEDEERYFTELNQRAKTEKEAREQRSRNSSVEDEISMKKSSILGGLMAPRLARQVRKPPTITDEELRAGRYADHALVGRVLSALGWSLLVIIIPSVFLMSGRKSPDARLARRMTDLLHPGDWIWLMVGGVIFPTLWYLSISRLTPWAAREWSVTSLWFLPIGGQFGSFILSLFIVPLAIASGLLAKRAAVFGLVPRFPWCRWLAAVACIAGVPAFGILPDYGEIGTRIVVPTILAVVLVAAFLLLIFFFGSSRRQLRGAALSRLVQPVWVAGMLMFALLVPFHYSEEKHWIQRDKVGEITAAAPAQSRLEYDVIQILRGELLEMLGKLPESR